MDLVGDATQAINEAVSWLVLDPPDGKRGYLTISAMAHLYYLFSPLAVRSPSELQRWRDDYGPWVGDYATIETLENYQDLVYALVYSLLTTLLRSAPYKRGVYSTADLYSAINQSPNLKRLLGARASYQPAYSILLQGRWEEIGVLDDETLAGIVAGLPVSDQPAVVERLPTPFSHPTLGLIKQADATDILYRYLVDRPYPQERVNAPLFRYEGAILPPNQDVQVEMTFPTANFLRGLSSAAQWTGVNLTDLVLDTYDNDSNQEVTLL
jgi:hypothetical protein